MYNLNEKLEEYAKLVVNVGINIQKGQPLVISSPIEGANFARLLTKSAYEAGASDVYINWSDEVVTRLKYDHAPLEVFENFPKWYADGLEDYAKKGAGFISISAQDPELLKGVDSNKIAAANKASSLALKNWRKYTMNDENPWCVVSIATLSWAKKIFPQVSGEEAVEKLWQAIFSATRMDLDNPIEAWDNHMKSLKSKVDYLNKINLKSLHYSSSNGTDLLVELPQGHIWAGGGAVDSKGNNFAPNMPTEEVFTMPLKTGVNGVVYSTKPLNYGGSLVDEFKLVFENGKVVDYDARVGRENLKNLFDIDEGARHLGEVALVPYDSPISNSNITFLNTLFDENASCHFAFGKAYPTNIKGGENMSDEELEAHGVNNSLTHVDFMVGSEDMNILGKDEDGNIYEIFKDGNWGI